MNCVLRAIGYKNGVPPSKVKSDFGEGRMVLAKDAVERGMEDRVESLDATLGRVAKGSEDKGRGRKFRKKPSLC